MAAITVSTFLPYVYGASSLFSLGTGISNLANSKGPTISSVPRAKLNSMFDKLPLKDLDYLSSREKDFFPFPFNNINILIEKKNNGSYNFFYKNYEKNELMLLDGNHENLITLDDYGLIDNDKVAIFIKIIDSICRTPFIDEEEKDMLIKLTNEYIDILKENPLSKDSNFIKKIFTGRWNRFFEIRNALSYDELLEAYNEKREIKDGTWVTTRHYDELSRFFNAKNKLKEIQDRLFVAFNNIVKEKDDFSKVVQEQTRIYKYKNNPFIKDIIDNINNNSLLRDMVYKLYKTNGRDFHKAIREYIKLQLKQGVLMINFKEQQKLQEVQRKNTSFIKSDVSDKELEQQVDRIFNIKETKNYFDEIFLVDEENGLLLFNNMDDFNPYIFDIKNINSDINSDYGYKNLKSFFKKMLYNYNNPTLFEKLPPKTQKIKTFLYQIDKNFDIDQNREFIGLYMMHCLKSMTSQPKQDKESIGKTIITVSKINGKDDKGEYINYMFDMFDPKTKIMKIGMVIKRGDDIFYKEDPGMETVAKITKTQLLQKLPSESGLDGTKSNYIGDLSQMKELIVGIKSLCKDEKDKIYLKNESLDRDENSQMIDKEQRTTETKTMENLKELDRNKMQKPTNLVYYNNFLKNLFANSKTNKNNVINKNKYNNTLNNFKNFNIKNNLNNQKKTKIHPIYDDLYLKEQELLNAQSQLSTMIKNSGIEL